MQNRQLVIVATIIVITSIFTISMFYSDPVLKAFGGVTLNSADVAKSIQIRMTPLGTNNEFAYNSFSRVGFVAGEGNFLLESVPSKDKKSFYNLVKISLEDKDRRDRKSQLDISIDIFSGDGEMIQSLKYGQCAVTEYFVHVVDSKGTIFFLKDDEGSVEIREVTKFECTSFTLNTTMDNSLVKILNDFKGTDSNKFNQTTNPDFSSSAYTSEGELFFNSNTNTLQKYVNGTWIDISGKGGPPSPRK